MEDVVTQDAGSAPAAAETSSPAQSSTPAPVSSSPQSENQIPYSRVKEMLSKHEQKIRGEYEPRLKQFEQQASGWSEFSNTMLKGLGLKQDPKPEYVDKATFEKWQKEFTSSLETKSRQERELERAQTQLEQAKAKYPEAFEVMGFESHVIDEWQKNPNKNLLAIAEESAAAQKKYFETLFAKRQADYAKQKEEAAKTQPIKSGGGTSSAAPSKDKMPSGRSERASYLQKKLRALKNGE